MENKSGIRWMFYHKKLPVSADLFLGMSVSLQSEINKNVRVMEKLEIYYNSLNSLRIAILNFYSI
jgi:hypothetical protein